MSSRSLLLVLGFVLAVSAAAPRAAHAQTTVLFLDSQSGDYVGTGQVRTVTTTNAIHPRGRVGAAPDQRNGAQRVVAAPAIQGGRSGSPTVGV
jgi:hypothetical protein